MADVDGFSLRVEHYKLAWTRGDDHSIDTGVAISEAELADIVAEVRGLVGDDERGKIPLPHFVANKLIEKHESSVMAAVNAVSESPGGGATYKPNEWMVTSPELTAAITRALAITAAKQPVDPE